MQRKKVQVGTFGVVILFLVTLVLGACQPVTMPADEGETPEATVELTPVSIGVGYIPSVQFASFYVAMEKGFFAEEGLEVSMEYGFENDYLKLVGVGERQFMIGSGDQVILGRAQELPVRYVMNWYTRYPVVLFAKEAAGISAPADLAGKRIGIPGPFGATYVAFRGLLEAAGLTEADVQVESIGFTQAAAVSEDSVDAAVDYAVSGPVVLQQAGEAITTIGLDDYLSMPSNGLVTNESTLEDDPELVRSLVRASLRGVEYTLANPDEAFAISLKYVPEAGGRIRRSTAPSLMPRLPTGSQLRAASQGQRIWRLGRARRNLCSASTLSRVFRPLKSCLRMTFCLNNSSSPMCRAYCIG